MRDNLRVSAVDLALCLSGALDLISHQLTGHHKRTAFIAEKIAREMGITSKERTELVVAALLHDAGAVTLAGRLEAADFERGMDMGDAAGHAYGSYALLRGSPLFSAVLPLVRHHHAKWSEREDTGLTQRAALLTNILLLADRLDVLLRNGRCSLLDAEEKVGALAARTGDVFSPDTIDALSSLAVCEAFWLDSSNLDYVSDSLQALEAETETLKLADLQSLSEVFGRVIDFRSRFTATHSAGVSATAVALARHSGFSPGECSLMGVAGNLHDLGKLAVPTEILEKPAALAPEEFAIIRSHTYHTYRVIENLEGLEDVARWAAFHHQRLDGKGYPFHRQSDAISLGSRIMAVADVFTALLEDRPYRKGMDRAAALRILHSLEGSALDSRIVALLEKEFDEVDTCRAGAQAAARTRYESFVEPTIDLEA